MASLAPPAPTLPQDSGVSLQLPFKTETSNSPHDSAHQSPEPAAHDFHSLVDSINQVLGPSSGIDSTDVDVEELEAVMVAYQSIESEWQRYAFADCSRGYTRNLVDHGNGKANLLLLVWTPGKGSPIHDHANAHCVMKILQGSLKETVYGWPCQRSVDAPDCAASPASLYPSTQHTCSAGGRAEAGCLIVKKETVYDENEVTYMSDRIGLHRISNPSEDEVAVSLHLYTPPNAAKYGCHIFDESTGSKSHVQQCHFYSELGVKM